jgi:hypothetical protein
MKEGRIIRKYASRQVCFQNLKDGTEVPLLFLEFPFVSLSLLLTPMRNSFYIEVGESVVLEIPIAFVKHAVETFGRAKGFGEEIPLFLRYFNASRSEECIKFLL